MYRRQPVPTGTLLMGAFYASMGGVHLGITAADPETYAPFADAAVFTFVREGWADVFMANPAFWGFCMFLGETLIAVLLLVGGRPAKVGWVLVVAFQLLLMLFGFVVWFWTAFALAVVVPLMRHDWPLLTKAPEDRRPLKLADAGHRG